MTDLLASLVDRALDRAPVLQRRQPTLFEPVAEAASSGVPDFGNTALLPEEETVVERHPSADQERSASMNDTARVPPPPPQLERPNTPPVESHTIDRRRVPDVSPRENDREHTRPEPVTTASITESTANAHDREARPTRDLQPRVVKEPEEITVAPQRLIETIVERRVQREIISEHLEEASTEAPPGLSSQSTNSREASRDHPGEPVKAPVRVEIKPASPPEEQTTIKPSTQRKPFSRQSSPPITRVASRIEATRALQPQAPPTIHVTIGRVEVRATPQAARPPAPRPAAPRMSLEDYLRSRGEGK